MIGALLGTSQAHRDLPGPGFAAALVLLREETLLPRVGRHPAAAICAATRR
jgi:hypothetical protein